MVDKLVLFYCLTYYVYPQNGNEKGDVELGMWRSCFEGNCNSRSMCAIVLSLFLVSDMGGILCVSVLHS